MIRLARSLAFLAGFVLLAGSCRPPAGTTTTSLLRTAQPDVVSASDRVADALYRQLQAGGSPAEGYPVRGHVIMEPDPSDPGVEVMSCAPGSSGETAEMRCILLSENDFIRVQPVTWQSAAFYMYRIYIAPRSPFARMDPAKDFIAIDLFGLGDGSQWPAADQAIRRAAAGLGARPFRP